MPKVMHFEIPADKPERAIRFYKNVFGWKIAKLRGKQPYWLVTASKTSEPGINGAIARRKDVPVNTNTITVPSLDKFTKKVIAAGGKVVMPRMVVPRFGYMAYFTDTENNSFGLMEVDPKAR
jgi:uncharacterized protein